MRIRRMREKDADAAAVLLCRSGLAVDGATLVQRIRDFQYQRNHMAAVAEHRGRVFALIHIGAEPSLTCGRCARVYTLLTDAEAYPPVPRDTLLGYARQWAKQHGCEILLEDSAAKAQNKKGL